MARARKLKVFRTPIGFHDAYVAAPSRKAALAAWGSDADLFARGIAEQVDEPELVRAPLDHPGTVIKRLRGTADEQYAALPADPPRRARHAPSADKPGAAHAHAKPRRTPRSAAPPRPSRAALDAAERDLGALEQAQKDEDRDLRRREEALERERRSLDRAHQRARTAAQHRLDRARDDHAVALDRWIAYQG